MESAAATVGVMPKNTSLQLWCTYHVARVFWREEVTDYCTLWSLVYYYCKPPRFACPGINESCHRTEFAVAESVLCLC